MKMWLWKTYFQAKRKVEDFVREERGDSNIIAVILLILAVIAIAAIFKNQITDIVNKLFINMKTELGI